MRTVLLVLVALASGMQVTDPAPQLPYARQALDLGRTRDDALLAAFHRSYELTRGDVLDRAEIITEFRRAVMMVRDHADRGEYAFSAQDLAKAMQPFTGQITFVVQARLHPLHTYANAPPYALYIETGPATKPIAPKPFRRDAAYPPGMAGPGSTISGVLMEGTFRRAEIEAAPSPSLVVADDQANVIWKARLDLTRYR
jgi:hypothetical protein